MPWWLLLLLLAAVWLLAAIACLVEEAVERKRFGIANATGRGQSVAQFLFCPPLLLGIALAIDYVANPWGTRVIGSLHAVLGVVLAAYIAWALYYLNVRSS
jgi:hypothetical protein